MLLVVGRGGDRVSACCRWRYRRKPARGGLRVLYFVAIGLGYIMVEIAFIQRFVLFLGYPTYALTVVYFLMLLSSGREA